MSCQRCPMLFAMVTSPLKQPPRLSTAHRKLSKVRLRRCTYLPNAVAARGGLQVVLRVPVAVEDDHGVSRGQVDTHTPGLGRQQEDEHVTRLVVEAIDGRLVG